MIDKNKIISIHHRIETFIAGNEKRMEFDVDCELKDRISFIYKAIFKKGQKTGFYFRYILAKIAYWIDYSPIKVFLYRCLGVKIGRGVFISPQVTIDVHFPKLIIIDDYVIMGYGSYIFTHDFLNNQYRIGRVHIKKGAVVGAFVAIGCGVTIDENVNIMVGKKVINDIHKKN